MRYHIVVYYVPDVTKVDQVPFVDEEFNSDSSADEVVEGAERFIASFGLAQAVPEIRKESSG